MRLWTNLESEAFLFVAALADRMKISQSRAIAFIIEQAIEDTKKKSKPTPQKKKKKS